MEIFAAFLRGVNMTGHNKIKMKELSLLFRNLGYENVETYIQSGNVTFSTSGGIKGIATEIENAIRKKFNFEIPVMIRTPEEMRAIREMNPFLTENEFDPAKSAVIFLQEEPSGSQLLKAFDINYPPDKFKIIGKEIFIYCPNGFGKTRLYTNFFEDKLKVTGTARNWKTITAITDNLLNFFISS